MGSDDSPHDEKAQSIAAGFGCEIGFEDAGDVFWRYAASGVHENDPHMGGIGGCAHAQDAAGIHRLKRIAADVVESLLDLIAVDLKQWQPLLELLLDEHVAVLDFHMQKIKDLIDDAVDVRWFRIEALRADGAEKLGDDVVEARNLAAGNQNGFFQLGAKFWRRLFQVPLHELEVDVQRVEGIADFMGNTRRQHRERGEFLDLDGLLRVSMGLRDVAQDHRTANRLGFVSIGLVAQQRHDVEIQKPVVRIKYLQITADDFCFRPAERLPVDTSHDLSQRLAEAGIGFNAEKTTRRTVEIENASLGICDDNAFENGVENGFQKTLLAGDLDEVVLHFAGLDQRETVDEFVEKSAFHEVVMFSTGLPVPARQNAQSRDLRDGHSPKRPIRRMAEWTGRMSWAGCGRGCLPRVSSR